MANSNIWKKAGVGTCKMQIMSNQEAALDAGKGHIESLQAKYLINDSEPTLELYKHTHKRYSPMSCDELNVTLQQFLWPGPKRKPPGPSCMLESTHILLKGKHTVRQELHGRRQDTAHTHELHRFLTAVSFFFFFQTYYKFVQAP